MFFVFVTEMTLSFPKICNEYLKKNLSGIFGSTPVMWLHEASTSTRNIYALSEAPRSSFCSSSGHRAVAGAALAVLVEALLVVFFVALAGSVT